MFEALIVLALLILFMLPFALIGLFLFIQVVRPSKSPTDASNVINRMRLVWFACTRQELFVDVFEWLKHDELDNVKGK